MQHEESDIAQALVTWWRSTHPSQAGALIHIPNGAKLAGSGYRRAQQWARLEKEGARAGVADYFLAIPVAGRAGLWLELKSHKGRPTQVQRQFLNDMTANGYRAEWVRGIDDAKALIDAYLNGE